MSGTERTTTIIIGAGFGGICLGARLRMQGREDFVILERADDIGGVWRDNDYPGAACDIPAVFYSYSFEPDYPWSSGYPPQPEILDYMRGVVGRHGLGPHLRLGRAVTDCAWDEARGLWRVTAATGESWEGAVLVPAVGIFNDPVIPDIAGRADFAGLQFHSTDWRHELDYAGRKVAVVGTGASAIQIVPELVRMGAELTLFQRTAPYVVAKSHVDAGQPRSERDRLLKEFDAAAGRRFDRPATAAAQAAFLDYLAEQVPDPKLREKLTPPFLLGCKRGLFSNHWYPALQQPNAHVVTERIERVEPGGIRTVDGTLHEAEILVWATGFNPTNYLPGITVTGRGGRRLSDAWAEGAEAYLGLCVAGFPNMFLMFGPGTNVPGSIIYMLECQADYILRALERIGADAAALDVREAAMRAYCDDLQRQVAGSSQAPGLCQSYYMTASGKVVTQFPGTQSSYLELTRDLRLEDFHRLAPAPA